MAIKPVGLWVAASVGAALLASAALADGHRDEMGYTDLVSRLGAEAPDGTGVIVGQVEAPSSGAYAPNPADNHFTGKTFVLKSGASGTSNHANTVGRHAYGLTWSNAPGVLTIHCWEVNNWIGAGFLRLGFGAGNLPLAADVDLFNHSWIGSAGGSNNEALRRVDYVIENQHVPFLVGVNNGAGPLDTGDSLLSHGYNVIAVGRSDGSHHRGDSLGTIDGPGRMIPHIVAPDTATSWTTGLLSGVMADLIETARTWPGLDTNSNAGRSDVLKSVLLAGAVHRDGWSNNPEVSGPDRGRTSTPLDAIYGVDQANVNHSHLVFTGLERNGSTTVPTGGSMPAAAWDFAPIAAQESVYYRFEFAQPKDEFAVVATWNRRVPSNLGVSGIPNIDLELHRVDGAGNLLPLTGDDGLGVFGSGNVVSESLVDNLEHLYMKDLVPGAYVLEVRRANDGLADWDVAVSWLADPDVGERADLINLAMLRGTLLGGGLAELDASDDQYVQTRSGFGQTFIDLHSMELAIDAVSGAASPVSLDLTIESRVNQPSGTAQIRLLNHQTNQFDLVSSYALNSSDAVRVIGGLDPAKYIDGSGAIELRIKHIVFIPIFAFRFDSFLDEVRIDVF